MSSKRLAVLEGNLENGRFGNLETVCVMRRVARLRGAHPKIRELSHAVLLESGVESQNHIDEALVLGEFVRDNVRYVKDADGIEQLTDPLTLIEQLASGSAQGDCDDQSLLLASLLVSVGIRPSFRLVRYKTMVGPYNHVYVIVTETNWAKPRERIVLDPILKRAPMGAEVPHKSGDDFEV